MGRGESVCVACKGIVECALSLSQSFTCAFCFANVGNAMARRSFKKAIRHAAVVQRGGSDPTNLLRT